MGESHHQYQQQQHQPPPPLTRMAAAMRSAGGGEIVEVQGGHIVRSTGRKDRHSKVCTAKGPRDRRVRLSAHTAIKFYDVQDRLGYDRPSKAVDWLIKNSKPAIDELDELPPWQPTAAAPPNPAHPVFDQSPETNLQQQRHQSRSEAGKNKSPVDAAEQVASPFGFQHLTSPSFLPPNLESDVIADTIKSFFPMPSSSSSAAVASSSIHFQSYPPDLLSRTSGQSQDLRLSLQSFQDPILMHHHHHHQQQTLPMHSGEQALFSGASAPLTFDSGTASWSEQPHQEMGRFQRMIAWNAAESGGGGGGGGGGGYVFSSPSPMPLLGQNPFFSQRGPLQSSNSPSVRAWADVPLPPQFAAEHHQLPPIHHHLHHPSTSSISAIGFASGGFSGFRIPARIQGEEEHDAVDANRPPPASSAPRH